MRHWACFWRLYQQMTVGQGINWAHKGMPLVWMSACYARLGFVVHAKRYLMLTLVEDALRERGVITTFSWRSRFSADSCVSCTSE